MKKRAERRKPPKPVITEAELHRRADEATARMLEIHARYTTEALQKRLAEQGFTQESTREEMKPVINAEVQQMLAEYAKLDKEYGLPEDFSLNQVEDTYRIIRAIEGQHRFKTEGAEEQ